MGCVSYSLRFFPDGKVDKKRFQEAEISGRARDRNHRHGVSACRLDRGRRHVRYREGHRRSARVQRDESRWSERYFARRIVETARHGHPRRFRGGAEDCWLAYRPSAGAAWRHRHHVGGLFDKLGVEHLTYSEGALRLGVLYDLLGRFHHHDMRDSTVQQFMHRYQVDARQAERVERTAFELLSQLIRIDWPENEKDVNFRWAAFAA